MSWMPWGSLVACAAVLLGACIAPIEPAPRERTPVAGDSALVDAFVEVAEETGVPAALLAALAHTETRFRFVDVTGEHAHSVPRVGLFGLTPSELARGASLAGESDHAAATEPLAATRAAAALLRAGAPDAITIDEFLAPLSASKQSAIRAVLARGIDARDLEGGSVIVAAVALVAAANLGTLTQALVGYAEAEWIPANPANYRVANRSVGTINHIVVHTTQGAFNGTISWFKNAAAGVSAHYVFRSNDGHIVQMVDEKNVAWHNKCFNDTTIGLEHEGFIADPELWYTEAMYVASAAVTANLADRYGIEKVKGPIIGHGEAPDCSSHTDPGEGWDWDHYIDLVRTGGAPQFDAADLTVDAPAIMVAGERATVTVMVTNRGNTTWSIDATRLGTAAPQDRESALFVDGDWVAPNRTTSVDFTVDPAGIGTFTFDIVAPDVTTATTFDETFQLVEEGVAFFGPEAHVVVEVLPAPSAEDPAGCSAGRAGSSGVACAILALGVVLLPRRRSIRTALRRR